jgi:hypothetical protein
MQARESGAARDMDSVTAASVTIAWVILLNKPFYPLYVWWFIGQGTFTSCLTLLGAPLFAAVVVLAKRNALLARAALPLAGLVDTTAETFVFGANSGTELFLLACGMLAAVSFYAREVWWKRAVTAIIFVSFAALHGRYGAPLHPWTEADLSVLRNINIFAVASLSAFIAFRYPGK